MSDPLRHECGLAFIRLLKPLRDYSSPYWALRKLQVLLEKQKHRGQDGTGVAAMKISATPGKRYISRHRSNDKNEPIGQVFRKINRSIERSLATGVGDDLSSLQAFERRLSLSQDPEWLVEHAPFIGDIYIGHVRYGTYGSNSIESVHPFLRQNNWRNRNLIVAGNFNMTNAPNQFTFLKEKLGQHPKEASDTVTVMEKIGHFLDDAVERLHLRFKDEYKGLDKQLLSQKIGEHIDIQDILINSSKDWDGGYVICGIVGNGDSFVLRDPHGIRPAFFYRNDQVIVVASERPCIQVALGVDTDDIEEIPPGYALVISKSGQIQLCPIMQDALHTPCSFERFYFSKGTDRDIYLERKKLGAKLASQVEHLIDFDFKNTVFSFIPESSEIAFLGLVESLNLRLNARKRALLESPAKQIKEQADHLISSYVRVEKVILKDKKMRTFISSDKDRKQVTSYAYDLSYGTVKSDETLVLVDDSIIRGNTLENQIITLIKKLSPKKIVVVSSAPIVKYPDCYGIDMSKLTDFIAFRATRNLYTQTFGKKVAHQKIETLIKKAEIAFSSSEENKSSPNILKAFYEEFSDQQLIQEMERMLSENTEVCVRLVFQKIEDLHACCPNHHGDWYFSGNYPTLGGTRVANRTLWSSTIKSRGRDYE